MGTHDPVGFSSIRRQVWAKFCTRGSVSGTNIVANGFVGPGLVFLNPYRFPCTQTKIISTPILHSPVCSGRHTSPVQNYYISAANL
jgi:hypothetical protein